MAKKVYVQLDLLKTALLNLVIQNLATAPASPTAGQKYFNTTDNCEYYYNGSVWVKLEAQATIPTIPTDVNIGTGGVGLFKQRNGNNNEFKSVKAASTKVTVTDNTANNTVDLDIVPANIDHQTLSGAGSNNHAAIDSHLGNSSNPHSTTKTQVGLGSVDNVQQLPMSYLDTDTSLTANSDVKVASQKAVKTYVDAQNGSQNTTISANATTMNNHISNTSNPHATTKAQVSLGNVDNVQQLPMSYLDTDGAFTANSDAKVASQKATKTYMDGQVSTLNTTISGINTTVGANQTTMNNHISNTSNPHATTKAQVSLGNVDNVQQLPMSYLDTDGAFTANSDAKVASQKATKTYMDGQVSTLNTTISGINTTVGANQTTMNNHISNTSNPHSTTKAQVGLGNVDNLQQLPLSYLDTDTALANNSDSKVASQKAVKSYVDGKVAAINTQISGMLVYAGTIDGSKTLAANGITSITKGQYWKVAVAGSATGITTPSSGDLGLGDQVIANQTSASPTAAMFDAIDNTESADLVKLAASQTLTNKTIDAGNNTISGLGTGNFGSGVIQTAISSPTNSQIPTALAVKNYADNAAGAKSKKYTAAISAASTGTIAAATHGCGTLCIVAVYETVSTNLNQVECDIVLNASGDVTWTTSATISGQIVIVG